MSLQLMIAVPGDPQRGLDDAISNVQKKLHMLVNVKIRDRILSICRRIQRRYVQ